MGNYNTKDISVNIKSNKKRPHQIEKYLITSHPEYTLNHLIALKELININCEKVKNIDGIDNIDKFIKENDLSLYETQHKLACLVKYTLKNFDRDLESIAFGDKSLQKIFYPISELSKGVYGVTMLTGYKGSKPFMIMKSAGPNEEYFRYENNLHEIVVGLLLNNLRKEIPNFMFLYGGFYCAPPILLNKYFKYNNEYIENISKKKDILYEMPEEFYDLQDENEDEEEDRISDIYEKKMKIISKQYKKGEINLNKFIKNRINILEELKNIDKNNQSIIEIINKKLEILKNVDINELENLIEKTKNEKESAEFDLKNFCNNDLDKTTLVLYEYISESTSLDTFIENGDISIQDKIKVMNQIFLALYTAYKKYNFIHKDLHPGNVLVKKLDKEINITYLNKFNIKCEYISVMIDYGLAEIEWNGLRLGSLNEEFYHLEDAEIFTGSITLKKDFEKLISNVLEIFNENKKLIKFPKKYKFYLLEMTDEEIDLDLDEWINEIKNHL